MAAKMTTLEEPDAPSTSAPAADPPPVAAEPDDIVDPAVPPAVLAAAQTPALPPLAPEWHAHETLLQGFCQHLMHRFDADMLSNGKQLMQTFQVMADAMQRWIEGHVQANEHSQYQLSDALLKLQERGLVVVQNPYQATVAVRSPQGYPVTVQLAKRDAGELLDALQVLLPWLQAQHYSADAAERNEP
jgi:hypothetical protein